VHKYHHLPNEASQWNAKTSQPPHLVSRLDLLVRLLEGQLVHVLQPPQRIGVLGRAIAVPPRFPAAVALTRALLVTNVVLHERDWTIGGVKVKQTLQ
jgi:hypothetical protein